MKFEKGRADAEELRYRAWRRREFADLYGSDRGQPLIDLAGELEVLAERLELKGFDAAPRLAGARS